MANNYEDITLHQGTDIAIELHLTKESDGTAFDLTNYSAAAKMKRNYNDSADDPNTVAFNAIIPTPATSGIVTLSLTSDSSATLQTRGRYVYDVEVSFVDSSSNTIVQRVAEGQIEVTPSVT
jgi:hypothetical protein|tara:strand:- start:2550 stop:2915 length:366 start_codon:yes stop_codon:yes gene_type:complete